MRFSYKKLVDRFNIPRPTLIEWQKRVQEDKGNWRVKHLNYLREQVLIEEMTFAELRTKPIIIEDIFLLSVYLFFTKDVDFLDTDTLKKGLRSFGSLYKEGVEYHHDFAKRIWSIDLDDGSKRKISNYYNTIDLMHLLTVAQYALLMRSIVEFVDEIKDKINPSFTDILTGLTWQEIYTYDKAFSEKSITKYFINKGILFKGQSSFSY